MSPEKKQSGSSRIFEYLKTLSPDAEFTPQMISEDIGVSEGASSGFIHKCVKTGAVKFAGLDGHRRKYVVSNLDLVVVRGTAGAGTRPGRTVAGTTSGQKIASALRQLADQTEELHADLSSYSTSDLIMELARRERSVQRAARHGEARE